MGFDRDEGRKEDTESEKSIMTKNVTTYPTVTWKKGKLIVLALTDKELENHEDQGTAQLELTRRNEERAKMRNRLRWNRG